MEVLFPGSTGASRPVRRRVRRAAGSDRRLRGSGVGHGPAGGARSGAPPYALRVGWGGRVVAYSGDTEWTESLVEAASGADLFVCEAYTFDTPRRYHLDFRTLAAHREQLGCRRLVLTHLGPRCCRVRPRPGRSAPRTGW